MLSNTYGLNIEKRDNGVIPILICKFIDSIKNKTDIHLKGNGKSSRNFIYGKDVNKILNLLSFLFGLTTVLIFKLYLFAKSKSL